MNEENSYNYLNELFNKAFEKNAFGFICSILRIRGMSDANWEPFDESRKAFEDYNWLLHKSEEENKSFCTLRIGLLMYCQAVEMSAPHEILANILRCINNQTHIHDPFESIKRRKKDFSYSPPSAKSKFSKIKELADQINEGELKNLIDSFFDDKIRNAFIHSDYILTDSYFRYTEGQPAQQIELKTIQNKINNCIIYYSSFMKLHRDWLFKLAHLKKYHKWPNYEVLELLSSKEEGLYGFNVHFSNGSKATYSRRSSGVEAINIFFEKDGQLNFMSGSFEDLESIWKINGQPVDDWEEFNRK